MSKNSKIISIGIILLVLPLLANADILGQEVNFNIDLSYDLYGREKISATLVKITNQLYFYVDDNWWQKLDETKKRELDEKFYNLSTEFEYKIYPTLTSNFGSEPKPGIDKDEKITVLIHPMRKNAGGYFNTGDEYPKIQNPESNEREMVYLNAQYAGEDIFKSLLSHEFTHLIELNQKDLLRNVSEETWLNEARAEYAPTLMGYDNVYKGSNLQNRVEEFLKNPSDSLTEWQNKSADYGVLNLFTQYLIDHYDGVKILADSLKSSKIGIPSINEALVKNGFKEDFSQIFTDWLITVLVNNCNLSEKYCYKNPNLKNLRISPQINFLPLTGETILTAYNTTKNWTGNWQKIVGGKGNLALEFDGADEVNFKVPYLACDKTEKCSVDFLTLDKTQKGEIILSDFNKNYSSLTIIPSIQSKISGFDRKEISYLFSIKVTTSEKTEEEKEEELKKQLLAQIDFLQKEIARIQSQINEILAKKGQSVTCSKFERDLYFGMTNSAEVSCLQEFLKSPLACGSEIYPAPLIGERCGVYPEGLITGNFLNLTRVAVIRFQEKYAGEILTPVELEKGTGFVGGMTRAKINQLLGF